MNMVQSAGIRSIVGDAIAGLPDGNLATAVEQAFEKEQASVNRIEECFEQLTSRAWSRPTLERFFHAWRDTHLSAGSVAGMTCRLLALAEKAGAERSHSFKEAAGQTARIIHEDLGLCGETHAELYNRLATSVCDGDEWELRRNRVPSAFEFRNWVHHQRVVARDLQEGLLTTIASEIYNHGEYSMLAPMFNHWLEERLAFEPEKVQRDIAYIAVHTGGTESGHFMYGMHALRHYCEGAGIAVHYPRIEQKCTEYLSRVGRAFEGIAAALH